MDYRPTKAEIDLDALARNVATIRSSRPGLPLCCVIKADAYGHGLIPVARILAREGVELLAVALVEEGLQLRAAGVTTPILVLGAALSDGYEAMLEHTLTPVLFSTEHVRRLADAARKCNADGPVEYHLKIDTGMTRLGVRPERLDDFLSAVQKEPALRMSGVMTHLANADLHDLKTNAAQLEIFESCLGTIKNHGFAPQFVHLSNSAGSQSFPAAPETMLRPGLLLYGWSPLSADQNLDPVLRWTTEVVHLQHVPAGTPVSYGGRFITDRVSTIATLPVGYADGYSRALSNRADVLVREKRARVVGAVCMDLLMLDVTDVEGVQLGDEVVLLGRQGSSEITAQELADRSDTIAYEIVTGIQKRVPRVYVGRGANEAAA